jgi:NAD(P)-dependent dehydrogenase (short-subunit alcohol dehydrogenase family)
LASPEPFRVALVTGASQGIGRAVAEALLADGWQVGLLGRRRATLQAVVDALPAPAAAHALVLEADVTAPAAVTAAFAALQSRWGRLDLLFNNAGVFTPPAPIADFPLAAWQQSVDTNLTGMFLCLQQAFRLMSAQQPGGGRILNNGSISAQVPRPHAVAYAATKHAVNGLTKAAALEGRGLGIAVGQIDIGNVATDMTAAMADGVLQPDGQRRPEARMPMARVVDTVLALARLPLDANVLQTTILATAMPFSGRG